MPVFDLFVVGSGGGPSETNTSGYLVKVHGTSWADGILAIEAGSALGALQRILKENPQHFDTSDGRYHTAAEIYAFVETYLITHAHLDHVLGLILMAGAVGGCRKNIRGSRQTLKDLESVFAPSRLWPNLASWEEKDLEHKYLYNVLDFNLHYSAVLKDVSVSMMPLSHSSLPEQYESSAFFVRHDPSSQEFLFFGDVEPDSLATNPHTIDVWRRAAPLIPDRLSNVFIECSWPSGREDSVLYGHLTPEHLVQELINLAQEVHKYRSQVLRKEACQSSPTRKRQKVESSSTGDLVGVLDGLTVHIVHCKEDMTSAYDEPIQLVILKQVQSLLSLKGLGVAVRAAQQGQLIEI